ncbi:MAG: phosphatase PAP2 family protein [Candidatus Nanopelagicales bacterium]
MSLTPPVVTIVHPRARVRAAGLAAAGVLALLWVLVAVRWAPLMRSDEAIDTALHDWALRTPAAVDAARWLQTAGDTGTCTVVVVVTVMVLLVTRRWWLALTVAVVGALAPLATNLIKPVVDRDRPVWAVPFEVIDQPSFPSGHATGGVAVWLLCGVAIGSLLRDPSLGALVALPFVVLGIAIGLSRLVLGVHWPSDVVAGWAVAVTVTCIAGVLFLASAERTR